MRVKTGFMFTDEEDALDKLLIRVLGFTILGVSYLKGGWLSITVLGCWVQWRLS